MEKDFEIKINSLEKYNSVYSVLSDWCKIVNNPDVVEEDLWYEIPGIPQYRFKNLIITDTSITSDSINFKLNYDEKIDSQDCSMNFNCDHYKNEL
jgi:hypothetical protein